MDAMIFGLAFGRRKIRHFKERKNPLRDLDDETLRKRYRFGRDGILFIARLLQNVLQRPTKRSRALSVVTQVLIALRFYASGSFQQVIADTLNIDKSTASRVINEVSLALSSLIPQFIQWPTTRERRMQIQSGFFRSGGFPGVIGCIDGTHIKIQGPRENENVFVNRKGFHSINVQAVCDNDGRFTNIVAKWPGCTHDSHIFRMSELKEYMEHNHRTIQDGIILGDSGYACMKYLMTPFLRPATRQQERYNAAHKRTRTAIERTFGVWKRRFHVLHGEIRIAPERVCNIIGACAVLHNIAVDLKEPMESNDVMEEEAVNGNYDGQEDGRSTRNHIAMTYFSQ